MATRCRPSSSHSVQVLAFSVLAVAFLLATHAQAQSPEDGEAVYRSSSLDPHNVAAQVLQTLREVMAERGLREDDVDGILYATTLRLLNPPTASKRGMGWKQIPIQTRFAPFGTKLVPSRDHSDSNGPTLLRYGRSV